MFLIILFASEVEKLYASMPSGALAGRVIDENSQVLKGSSVYIANEKIKFAMETKNGNDGTYNISSIPSGKYIVKCSHPNYAVHIINNVQIYPGKVTVLNITLSVKGVNEVWTNQESFVSEWQDSINKMTITSNYIGRLPLPERDMLLGTISMPNSNLIINMETAKPSQQNLSIAGGSGRNINIIIDGGDNSDEIYGGSIQTPPLISLSSYTILSGNFPAEYGLSSAAIINSVIKDGLEKNNYGTLFFQLRNNMLSRQPYSQRAAKINELSFNRVNFGGSYSNKIIKNKMHFYTAFEYLKQNNEILVDTNKIFSNEDGIREIDKSSTKFLIKLTDIINNKQRVAIRYGYQKDNDNYDVFGYISHISPTSWGMIESNSHTILLNHSYYRSANTVNEFVFEYSYYKNDILPNSKDALMFFPNGVRYGNNPDAPQEASQMKINLKEELSFIRFISKKKHNLKAGIDLFIVPKLEVSWKSAIDIPQYTFLRNDINSPINKILIMGGEPIAKNENSHIGVYCQDDFWINDRLLLNAGIRYDIIIGNGFDQSDSSIYKVLLEDISYSEDYLQVFKNNPNFRNDLNNIQPRISISYDLKGNSNTLINVGYGRYTEMPYFKRSYLFPKLALSEYYIKYFYFANEGILNSDGSYWKIGDPLPPSQIQGERVIRDIGTTEFKVPYVDQFSVSIEHNISRNSAIEFNFTHSSGKDQFIAFRFNSIDSERDSRRFPNISPLARIWYPGGYFSYNSLDFVYRKNFLTKYDLIVSYSISKIEGNILSASDSYYNGSPTFCSYCLIDVTDLKSARNAGPLNTDCLHKIKVIGLFQLPRDIMLNIVGKIHSGFPYNNYTIVDLNGDGFNYDLPSNYSSLNQNRGDWFTQVDLHLSRLLKYGKLNLEVILDVYNLFNGDNPSKYIGNVDSANYGQPTIWAGDNNYFEQFIAQVVINLSF